MSSPIVTVILPVYNGEDFVRHAIESVLKQTLRDIELVVVDDGSQDSTAEIARGFDGGRVRYIRQENTGVVGAFNHGLRLARGRYISWLSHDDLFLSEKLEKQVTALARLDGPAACYTDVQMINPSGEVVAEHRLPEHDRGDAVRHILTGSPITLAAYSICYDRRCIEEVGFYSERWPYTQDAEMLFRLARRFPLVRVPEFLTQVREHAGRTVRSPRWEREAIRFFSEHLNALPLRELFPNLSGYETKRERSRAYQQLGDALAAQAYPVYRAAFSQYRRAMHADPTDASQILRKTAWLARRYLADAAKRRLGRSPN